MNSTGVYLSDLSRCEPRERLSSAEATDTWRLIEYETEDGLNGTMVAARPEHECGELTLPLDVNGPHRVFLGINYTKSKYTTWHSDDILYGQLEVKLSDDFGFHRVGLEVTSTSTGVGPGKSGVSNSLYKSIQDAYWRTADLTHQALVIRQPHAPYRHYPYRTAISNLSYVRLVPLTEEEIAQWRAEAPDDATRRVAIQYCTGHMTGHTRGTVMYHPDDRQWFRDEIAPFTDSDVGLMIVEAMRGNLCTFRTSIGDVGPEDNRWDPAWVDPLEEFTSVCHEKGLRIFAALRMIGPQYPMNTEPIARASHFRRHPEWAKRDADGVPANGWSLAFPEVRQYWLSLMSEALEYGIDGLQLHLNRTFPFVLFEHPVIEAFREEHGIDPRELDYYDPRRLQHCAEYLTAFLREIRGLLDQRPNRQLGVTVSGVQDRYDQNAEFDSLRYGCDVEGWLREGLVDYVMPTPEIDPTVLRKWRGIGGDAVRIWPDLSKTAGLPEECARLAEKYYEAGADGLSLWGGERRTARVSEWAAVRLLGHRNLLGRIARDGPDWYSVHTMKYLAGLSVKHSFRDG